MLKQIVLLIILLLTINACHKEDIDDLKDNFSCSIEGEAFFPKKIGPYFLSVSYSTKETSDFNSFSMTVRNDSKRYMDMRIDINTGDALLEEKEYVLGKVDRDNFKDSNHANCYFERSGGSDIKLVDASIYNTTNEVKGTVTITKIDTENNTIIGRFQFHAINKFSEIIVIENGKFNVKYLD